MSSRDSSSSSNHRANVNTGAANDSMWLQRPMQMDSTQVHDFPSPAPVPLGATAGAPPAMGRFGIGASAARIAALQSSFAAAGNGGSGAVGLTPRRASRLPSLAMCEPGSWGGGGSQGDLAPSASQGAMNPRASLTNAHGAHIAALQEQAVLARAAAEDAKAEVRQLAERLELEQRTAKRWKERCDAECEARAALERRTQEQQQSGTGELQALRDEAAQLAQDLRDERRRGAAARDEAVRQLTEKYEAERESQERWWRESAADTNARIALLEQAAAGAAEARQALEEVGAREAQLQAYAAQLESEVEQMRATVEAETRRVAAQMREDHAREVLQLESGHVQRMNAAEAASAERLHAVRARVADLEHEVGALRPARDECDALRAALHDRDQAMAALRQQAAAARAAADDEHMQQLARADEQHRARIDAMAQEFAEETARLRARVSAAGALEDRCSRLERQVQSQAQAAERHDAEVAAVMSQLEDVQRQLLVTEAARGELQSLLEQRAEAAAAQESQHAAQLQEERAAREAHMLKAQETIDAMAQEHADIQGEWETNLAEMLARVAALEADNAGDHSTWAKERAALRTAEHDAQVAAADAQDAAARAQELLAAATRRAEEAERAAAAAQRDRATLNARVSELSEQLDTQAHQKARADVDLAAAKSGMRALETRLDVMQQMRAPSVAFGGGGAGGYHPQTAPSLHGGSGMDLSALRQSVMRPLNMSLGTPAAGGVPAGLAIAPRLSALGARPSFNAPALPSSRAASPSSTAADSAAAVSTRFSTPAMPALPAPTVAAPSATAPTQLSQLSQQSQPLRDLKSNVTSAASSMSRATKVDPVTGCAIKRMRVEMESPAPDEDRLVSVGGSTTSGHPIVAFSGFDQTEVAAMSSIVQRLGGTVAQGQHAKSLPTNCTHLVAKGQGLTVKVLAAHARGIWVVPADFLDKCAVAQCFVNEATNGGQRLLSENGSGAAPRLPLVGAVIGVTGKFKASKNFVPAMAIGSDGGAMFLREEGSADGATTGHEWQHVGVWEDTAAKAAGAARRAGISGRRPRLLLCTPQEVRDLDADPAIQAAGVQPMTWDNLARMLTP